MSSAAYDLGQLSEQIDRRRTLTETLLRAGRPINTGPAALAERIHPHLFQRLPHTDVMNDALARVLITPRAKLMITTPPRVGKSTLISRYFPMWWLTMLPRHHIVLGSYAASLAMGHGTACRDMITSYGHLWGLSLSQTQATKQEWELDGFGGGMLARGIRGGITGKNMDLGIIDDPISGRDAAESETVREAVWDWYSGSWTSRVVPHTRQILVMTRWRADDLAGRLLDRDGRLDEGGQWDVVHLPAIALAPDPDKGIYADPLGREPGEPLPMPDVRVDDLPKLREHWAEQRARSSSRDWNALYQGVPFDAEGALLTEAQIRDRTATPPTSADQIVRAAVGVDPSGSGNRDTAGVVGGVLDTDGRGWWTHDRTARMTAERWSRVACELAIDLNATRIVVEANYGGDQTTTVIRQAWATLEREGRVPDGMLCPLLVPVHSRQSKVLRAEPIAQAVMTERAWFAPGLQQFTDEWQLWTPGSKYSPGALDAGVHLMWDLLPPIPRGSAITTAAGRSRTAVAQESSMIRRRRR